jgi:DeoR family ulaG and ulaABCDEF operon transcriptional repressor
MLREERFNLILTAVEGRDAVFYEEMLTMVAASGATLRREVDLFCEAERVRKVRGWRGAAPGDRRPLAARFFGVQARCAAAAKGAPGEPLNWSRRPIC